MTVFNNSSYLPYLWGIILISALMHSPVKAQSSAQPDAAASITAQELRGHTFVLASDEMKGRGTGTPEYRIVAQYAATQFRAAGLKPLDAEKTFLQAFEVDVPSISESPMTSYNVVGIVEGTDPALKNEYVVVGGHLDHLGIQDGEIHNGGNDNATGSASVIELAEAIASAPLKRSVIFMLFGAEEIGLHGSRYFVNNALIPTEKISVMINLDGIGRYNDQAPNQIRLLVVGMDKNCRDIRTELNQAKENFPQIEFIMRNPKNLFRRSDHYSFYQKDIPAFFVTDLGSGVWHTPEDDAEPVEYDKLAQLNEMILAFIQKAANRTSLYCK